MVVYMPKDPRYEGWGEALSSIGMGMKGYGEQKQEKAKDKGLLELLLMQEHGGVIPSGDISKKAKQLGIDEHVLLGMTTPVKDKENQIIGYKIQGKSERELSAFAKQAKLQDKLKGDFFEKELERTRRTAAMEADIRVTAAKDIFGFEQEQRETTQLKLMAEQHKNAEDLAVLKRNLEKDLSPDERRMMEAEIALKESHADYYKKMTDYIGKGKDSDIKNLDLVYKKLGLLGLTEKSEEDKIERIKPLIKDSKEHKAARSIFNQLGVEYDEVEVDKRVSKWMWPDKDVPAVKLIPRLSNRGSPRKTEYHLKKGDIVWLDGEKKIIGER